LTDALRRFRARGKKAVIVSNSEGMLESLFERLGILHCFDRVVDSGTLGIEKPDPRIFWRAYEGFGVDVQRVLHLGDSISTDIEGARAARVHSALLDPFGHWTGAYEDVPRVASVAAVVEEILGHCD
jgi:putative hydrolase of the HAD superfamily